MSAIQLRSEELPPISNEMVLKAIMLFREDPFSELGRGSRGIIMTFAERSHDVNVRISRKTVPFLSDKTISLDDLSTLLAAFTAGNVDSQLLRNQKKDDSYAGVLQVIEIYRQMKNRNPKLKIAEIEKFVDLEKRGKLKQYVTAP